MYKIAMLRPFLIFILGFMISAPALAKGQTPAKPAYAACAEEYKQQAGAYWPVLNDILSFEAMFQSYVKICRKVDPAQFDAVKSYADQLKGRVRADADASYDVMALLMAERLPAYVSRACKKDEDAQAAALGSVHRIMDMIRQKTAKRMNRTAREMDGGDVELCHNLISMKKDLIDGRLGGRVPEYPLFEAASMKHFQQMKSISSDATAYLYYGQARRKVAARATTDRN